MTMMERNKFYMKMKDNELAYIAGLFDGEGSIHIKRAPEKKKKHKGRGHRISNSMRISMEITMTDQSVLIWVHEILGVVH
jgi:intein/homing endonuclease